MASPSDGSRDHVPVGPATDASFSNPPPVGGTPVQQHRCGRGRVLLAAAVAVFAVAALLAALLVFRENRQSAPSASQTEATTQSATNSCDQAVAGWTTDVQDGGNSLVSGKITDVRTGRHDCYDRVVFDISSAEDVGYRAEYVPVVRMDASGKPVEVTGGAFIQLSIDAWVGEPVPQISARSLIGNPCGRSNPPARSKASRATASASITKYRSTSTGCPAPTANPCASS